jgi:hypothetical protein
MPRLLERLTVTAFMLVIDAALAGIVYLAWSWWYGSREWGLCGSLVWCMGALAGRTFRGTKEGA